MLTILVLFAHFACAFGLLLSMDGNVSSEAMQAMRNGSSSGVNSQLQQQIDAANKRREDERKALLKKMPRGAQLSGDPNYPYREGNSCFSLSRNGDRQYGATANVPYMEPSCFEGTGNQYQSSVQSAEMSPPMSPPPVRDDASSTLKRRGGTNTADTTAHATPASPVNRVLSFELESAGGQEGSQSRARSLGPRPSPTRMSSPPSQSGCSGIGSAITLAVILYALWYMLNSPQ